MSAKILKFTSNAELKTNLDAFDYDKYLEEMFAELSHREVRAGYNGETALEVVFTMPNSEWKRLRDKNLLGGLYNRDLSNFLSRKGVLKRYAVPSVDHSIRATKGRKTIRITF